MTKENFIQIIESLRMQTDHDREMANHINKVFGCDALYNTSIIQESVVQVLQSELNDVDEWISYFIFELDFGRLSDAYSVSFNGEPIPMETPEHLWNILH